MTSECYVHITLPGTTTPVVAGVFRLEGREGAPVGRFRYGQSYLRRKDKVEIDPVQLRLTTNMVETALLGGVFGALRDAAPDSWGRRVLERALNSPLGEIDYLLRSRDAERAGALSFSEAPEYAASAPQYAQALQLEKLQELADEVVAPEKARGPRATAAQELLLLGTSMGGSRPKTVIEDQGALWLAKFNRHDDQWNFARVEHAMLNLAADCEIQTPQHRVEQVGGRDVLLVKRFDREKLNGGYLRHRMVSALTLLQAEESERDKWSYIDLAEKLREISGASAPQELFKRMVFNALISNIDDHPRNHAAIAKGRAWALSPAYDLIPAPQVARERRNLAMTCGRFGSYANAANLESESLRFGIERDAARSIVDAMERRVNASWRALAEAAGVTNADIDRIESAFVYPGFRQFAEPVPL